MLIALLIAFSWEVKPLWVPKFVANEIQVSLATQTVSHKLALHKLQASFKVVYPDHFVE